MFNLYLRNVYRRALVPPGDHCLLRIEWCGTIYCDKVLPRRLQWALKIFTLVEDGLTWVMACRGICCMCCLCSDIGGCESWNPLLQLAWPSNNLGLSCNAIHVYQLLGITVLSFEQKARAQCTELMIKPCWHSCFLHCNCDLIDDHWPTEPWSTSCETWPHIHLSPDWHIVNPKW